MPTKNKQSMIVHLEIKTTILLLLLLCSQSSRAKTQAKLQVTMLKRQLALATMPFLAILFYIFLILFSIHVKSPPLLSSTISLHKTPPDSHPKFSLLVGVLTHPDKYDRRHFLRLIYGIQQPSPLADIDVKFVFCNLTKPEQRALISLEIMRFDDILILNCSENMNSGKTYKYFSSLPLLRRYDYVMKADDDVFLRLEPLALSLRPLPRFDLYYGFVIPCSSMNPFVDYMSGMGFVLSWDLVEWIGSSGIPAKDAFGPEDKMVGKWLNLGKKAKNRVSNKPAMYDYPGTNGRCSHDLIPGTVAVHRVKRWDQWLRVIEYFNVTNAVQSKLGLQLNW